MAIIQSILVGKGKGKIGNVVLSSLKGQTVAKQLNSSPSNPRTVAQTDNRIKMANAVLAWQFLANFMAYAKGIRKPLESTYNAFVRIVKGNMSNTLEASHMSAAASALTSGVFFGNWFGISVSKIIAGTATVVLSASGVSWAPSFRICVVALSLVDGKQTVIERAITEQEFNSGTLNIVSGMASTDILCAAYVYDSASTKITNISYQEV